MSNPIEQDQALVREYLAGEELVEFKQSDPILYDIVKSDLENIAVDYMKDGDIEKFNHDISYMKNIPTLYEPGARIRGKTVDSVPYNRYTGDYRKLPNGEKVPNYRYEDNPADPDPVELERALFSNLQHKFKTVKNPSSAKVRYANNDRNAPIEERLLYSNVSHDNVSRILANKIKEDKIKDDLLKRVSAGGSDQSEYDDVEIDPEFYEFTTKLFSSGGTFDNTKSHHAKKSIINNIKVCDYKSSDNNCLFTILTSACNSNGDKLTNLSCAELRKIANIPNGEMVAYNDPVIFKLAKHLNVDIQIVDDVKLRKVYVDTNKTYLNKTKKDIEKNFKCEILTEYSTLRDTITDRFVENLCSGEKTDTTLPKLIILFHKEHYYHVLNISIPPYCSITGEFLQLNSKGKPICLKLAEIRRILIESNRLIQKKKTDPRFMFFDFETIYEKSGVLRAYSCAVAIYDPEFNKNYPNLESQLSKEQILKTYGNNAYDYKDGLLLHYKQGKDLLDKIYYLFRGDNITKDDKYRRTILVGYNNSRFDNSILVKMLSARQLLKSDSIFMANNSILKLTFTECTTVDLCRFLNMPLAAACENFKCKMQKLSLDHSVMQKIYFEDQEKFWKQLADPESKFYKKYNLKEYNMMDVIALKELYFKVENALKHIYTAEHYNFNNLHDYITLSNMAYKCFKRDLKKKKIKLLPPQTLEEFTFLRKCIIAGRSQIFNYGKYTHDVESKDVKSLYPFVMISPECYYIAGKIEKQVTCEEEYDPTKLGFYECIVSNQPSINPNVESEINIIPYRCKDRPLNYDYNEPIHCNLSSVDIELCREFKCDVKIIRGHYYTNKTNKLFTDYYDRLIEVKNNEDHLKSIRSTDYNPALRTMSKGIQNGLAGKFLQRCFNTESRIVSNETEMNKFMERVHEKSVKFTRVDKNYTWCEGINKNDYNPKKAKEIQHGLLVYSYARAHMYKSILSKVKRSEIFAMDTDSVHMSREAINRLANLPENIQAKETGKYFGQFIEGEEYGNFTSELKDDYGAVGNKTAYYIAPKFYLYDMRDSNDKQIVKTRCKGVNIHRDKLISIDVLENWLKNKNNLNSTVDKLLYKTYYHSQYDNKPFSFDNILLALDVAKKAINKTISYTDVEQDNSLYKYSNEISRLYSYLSIEAQKKLFDSLPSINPIDMFEKLHKDKYTLILSSSLKRVIATAGSIGDMHQKYLLKMLCPKNEYIYNCNITGVEPCKQLSTKQLYDKLDIKKSKDIYDKNHPLYSMPDKLRIKLKPELDKIEYLYASGFIEEEIPIDIKSKIDSEVAIYRNYKELKELVAKTKYFTEDPKELNYEYDDYIGYDESDW